MEAESEAFQEKAASIWSSFPISGRKETFMATRSSYYFIPFIIVEDFIDLFQRKKVLVFDASRKPFLESTL